MEHFFEHLRNPLMGARCPISNFAIVDLPLPFEPSSPIRSSISTFKFKSRNTGLFSSYPTETSSSRIIGLPSFVVELGKIKGATLSSIWAAIGCILESTFKRDCACFALDAFARNRSTKASRWRRASSCFFIIFNSSRCCSLLVSSNWS